MKPPALVSIELSRRCQKGCHFCYNGSGPAQSDAWEPGRVIDFIRDLAANGTQAVSLGGGEPLEYAPLDEVFDALRGSLYLTMTSNGLLLDGQLERVSRLNPSKVHLSVHFPTNRHEVDRVIRQVSTLRRMGIRSGVNLLVRRDQVPAAAKAAARIRAAGIGNGAIVYLPMRGENAPSPAQLAEVAGSQKFQSMTCLMSCGKSPRFASVDAQAFAAHCSYTTERRRLKSFDARGLVEALDGLGITFCGEDDGG